EEAGLTAYVITVDTPLASYGRYYNRLSLTSLGYRLGGVHLIGGQQHPDNPCVFIGQCHSCLVLATSFDQPSEPRAATIRLQPDPAQRGAGAVHEEFPQIHVPPFTHPEQTRLTTCGMLLRHEPDPRRKLPSILEMSGVADRCHQRCGRERPNPRNCHETLTHWMGRSNPGNRIGIIRESFLQGAKFVIE